MISPARIGRGLNKKVGKFTGKTTEMKEFLFLTHEITDPYFNLASEEYLLKSRKENFIYLWRNSPAVIVGVNQNAFNEVNLSYTEKHGIKIVRRQTGGGAVYHDLNNLCYTVIAEYDENADNYRKFTAPVIEYLNSLGVKAEFSGRNDIVIDGKKISGNAQTVAGGRIMHHGTILFDTDMPALEGALKPNPLKMQSKGINSVRKRVTNVKEYLKGYTITDFKNGLSEFFRKIGREYFLTEEDKCAINKLVKEKYSTFEWNMGRSPKGKNIFEYKFPFGVFTLNFDTADGKICAADVSGDFFTDKDVKEFAEKLSGVKFTEKDMLAAFSDISEYIRGANAEEIIGKMFS